MRQMVAVIVSDGEDDESVIPIIQMYYLLFQFVELS